MDTLGAIFLTILIVIVLVTNIVFIRKINRTNDRHYKYKIFFFISSIISVFTILIIGALFQNVVLIDYCKMNFDIDSFQYRIIFIPMLVLINIVANFILLKSYLKRRQRKSKNKIIEIELIGTE